MEEENSDNQSGELKTYGAHRPDKIFTCDQCNKQFKHYSSFLAHVRFHEDNVYHCDQCSKKFAYPGYLKSHMKTHTTGENPYTCRRCNKEYKSSRSLRKHSKKNHPGEQSHFCDQCEEQFWKYDELSIGADSMGPAGLGPPNLRALGPIIRLSPPPNILSYKI